MATKHTIKIRYFPGNFRDHRQVPTHNISKALVHLAVVESDSMGGGGVEPNFIVRGCGGEGFESDSIVMEEGVG